MREYRSDKSKEKHQVISPLLLSTLGLSEEIEAGLREAYLVYNELRTPTQLYSFANYSAKLKQNKIYVRNPEA